MDSSFFDLKGIFNNLFTELIIVAIALVIVVIGIIIKKLSKEKPPVINVNVNTEAGTNEAKKPETRSHSCNVLSSFTPVNENEIIGRENDLTSIALKLQNTNTILLLNGMGGIGKTTLATLYAQKHKNEYENLVWINAAQGVYEGFSNDSTLAHNLSLTEQLQTLKEQNPAQFAELGYGIIVQALLGKENGLLVLDNEQGEQEKVDKLRSALQGSGKWKILITAREELKGIEPYKVDELNIEDARKLFYQYYTKEENDALVEEINELLMRHTLMVELIARTAQNRDEYHLQDLKNDLQTTQLNFAEKDKVDSVYWAAGDKRTEKLYHLLSTAFTIAEFEEQPTDTEEIKQEKQLTRQLLTYWCLMPERQPVKFSLFCELCQLEEQKAETNAILIELSKTGWLQRHTDKSEYLMHPVVQQALRWQLNPKPTDVESFVEGLLKQTDFHFNQKHTLIGVRYLQPFIQSVLDYFLNENLFTKENYPKDLVNISRLTNDFGLYHSHMGVYDLSLTYHLKDIVLKEKIYGLNSSETATSYSNIAAIYKDKGNLDSALKFTLKAIEIWKEVLDSKHPKLATSYNNIAIIYKNKGDLDNALTFALKAIEILEEVLDAKHPSLATSYNNIALIYQDKGDLDNALKFALKDIKIRKEVLNAKHPSFATSYNNIATIYYYKQEYPKAKEYIDKAVAIWEYNFPNGHPNLITSRDWQKAIDEKLKEGK